ncbi:hypothetical protein LP414_26410 [Polaromonas sp. P1(28)-13]|nr:hypothetical protein LP414_26410 [Polaromonas sp. P1(28)-13]
MITGWPSTLAMERCMARANTSAGPPGGKATSMVTGLDGNASCAWAAPPNMEIAMKATERTRLNRCPVALGEWGIVGATRGWWARERFGISFLSKKILAG